MTTHHEDAGELVKLLRLVFADSKLALAAASIIEAQAAETNRLKVGNAVLLEALKGVERDLASGTRYNENTCNAIVRIRASIAKAKP